MKKVYQSKTSVGEGETAKMEQAQPNLSAGQVEVIAMPRTLGNEKERLVQKIAAVWPITTQGQPSPPAGSITSGTLGEPKLELKQLLESGLLNDLTESSPQSYTVAPFGFESEGHHILKQLDSPENNCVKWQNTQGMAVTLPHARQVLSMTVGRNHGKASHFYDVHHQKLEDFEQEGAVAHLPCQQAQSIATKAEASVQSMSNQTVSSSVVVAENNAMPLLTA